MSRPKISGDLAVQMRTAYLTASEFLWDSYLRNGALDNTMELHRSSLCAWLEVAKLGPLTLESSEDVKATCYRIHQRDQLLG